MTEIYWLLIYQSSVLVLFFLCFWLVQLFTDDATIVDILWVIGVTAVALFWLLFKGQGGLRGLVVSGLIAFWGIRLMSHLFFRALFSGEEDPRYAALRKRQGMPVQIVFLFIYLGNAVVVTLFSLPFVAIALNEDRFGGFADGIALVLAVAGVVGESLADRQLKKFKRESDDPMQVCQLGLWRYSRHPNYFFEWVFWCSVVAFSWNSPLWWWSLTGPILMFVLLNYVTGIPPAEASSLRSRGDRYEAYQRLTSRFFPWFTKNAS